MPDEPVITAAINFRIVIRPLAKSAPSTASIDRFLQLEMEAPLGLSRKTALVAMDRIASQKIYSKWGISSAVKRLFGEEKDEANDEGTEAPGAANIV
jgi:hypothetical protein